MIAKFKSSHFYEEKIMAKENDKKETTQKGADSKSETSSVIQKTATPSAEDSATFRDHVIKVYAKYTDKPTQLLEKEFDNGTLLLNGFNGAEAVHAARLRLIELYTAHTGKSAKEIEKMLDDETLMVPVEKKQTKRQKQVQAAKDFTAAVQERTENILNALDHMVADIKGLAKADREIARAYKEMTKVIRAKAGEEKPEQPSKKEVKAAAKAFKKASLKKISKALGDFNASKKLLKKVLGNDKEMQKAYKKMIKLAK